MRAAPLKPRELSLGLPGKRKKKNDEGDCSRSSRRTWTKEIPLDTKDKGSPADTEAQEGDLAKLKRLLDPREAGEAWREYQCSGCFLVDPSDVCRPSRQGAAVRYLLGRGAAWVRSVAGGQRCCSVG